VGPIFAGVHGGPGPQASTRPTDAAEAAEAADAAPRAADGFLESQEIGDDTDIGLSSGNRLPAVDAAAGIRWDRAAAARAWFRRVEAGPCDHAGLLAAAARETEEVKRRVVQAFLKLGSPLLPVGQGGDATVWNHRDIMMSPISA